MDNHSFTIRALIPITYDCDTRYDDFVTAYVSDWHPIDPVPRAFHVTTTLLIVDCTDPDDLGVLTTDTCDETYGPHGGP